MIEKLLFKPTQLHQFDMNSRTPTIFLLLLFLSFGVTVGPTVAAENEVQFNRDIRPILSANCFACHGPDAKHREADLRLDEREVALKVGAIKPNEPNESELIRRILSKDEDEVMPPPSFHKELTVAEKELLTRWIEQGAKYEAHWAYLPPKKADVPVIEGVTNPIDAFLQRRLKQEGLTPAETATKETLIRRVTLDLTGLPPTLAEVEAFLADTSPKAWEKLIDRLMSRDAYGEQRARYWLDLARYADTHGMHLDNERSMWPYRDWVVRAFNENLPFDKFTRWQLAGDLLKDPTQDQHVASGFNRCNVTTGEGGSIQEEWIYRYAVDRTSTTAEVWMGLTAGCAVCHDHKFDPISTKEFYSMYAFFHSAADPAMDGNKIDTPPILRITTPDDEQRIEEIEVALTKNNEKLALMAKPQQWDIEDPATLDPKPEPKITETIWFEDGFPTGAKPQNSGGAALQLVSKEKGPVFSGELAITRTSNNVIAQDFYQGGPSFAVPKDGKFFVYCRLNKEKPPKTIMVQFHAGGWKHRAVWGDYNVIPWGKVNTTERVNMGALPKKGEWVRLEFTAEKVGLKPGMKVDGFAFTQFDGVVSWDHFGVTSTVDIANDPAWSWTVWSGQDEKGRNKTWPENLRRKYKGRKADSWTEQEEIELRVHWLTSIYAGKMPAVAKLNKEREALKAEKASIVKNSPITFVMADLPKPRTSYIMVRGQYDKPGEKVNRDVPSFLPKLAEKPADRDYNRLDLANWLVSGNHPLTARVRVNRIWQQYFGVGLVKTSADFGSQGEPPSHPELLDWLSVQFVEDGWDERKLIKRMLMSNAYRQSAVVTPKLLEHDPENRLLARGPRFRLDAEVLRDQALQVSGLLVPTMGGKGVRPYQPPNIWEPVAFGGSNTKVYKQGSGDDLYRRSLYTFLKRTAPPPFMSSFDAPNREQSCTLRGRSNTPMQALQLMNDIQHVEAARNFAQRILKEGGADDKTRVRWAWRTVTARLPDDAELAIVLDSLSTHKTRYQTDEAAAKLLTHYGESKPDETLSTSELASWTMVANLLFNLDEVVTKN